MKKMFYDFEAFREINKADKGLLIQYAILFKAWDYLIEELQENYSAVERLLYEKARLLQDGVWVCCENVTIGEMLYWNKKYFGYREKNKKSKSGENSLIIKLIETCEACCERNIEYYTEVISIQLITGELVRKSIIEAFFGGIYPMQDVKKLEKQQCASRNLQEVAFNVIFDEVGTGKTVSALYCVRNVLLEKGTAAKILIVCPSNKTNDWANDLRRQLGVYAYVAENSGKCDWTYSQNKYQFFKEQEPRIFVKANLKTDGSKEDWLEKWDAVKKEKWDMVIIDEGHERRDSNYNKIRAERAVLLTATPIGITISNGNVEIKKDLKYYIKFLREITGKDNERLTIKKSGGEVTWDEKSLFCVSKYFTQFFREDMGISATDRKIEFIEVERNSYRERILEYLRITGQKQKALMLDQDDEYMLSDDFVKTLVPGGNPYTLENPSPKRRKLLEYINSQERAGKSYIVFCEHKFVVEGLYQLLKEKCDYNTVVAYMHGEDRDISDKVHKISGNESKEEKSAENFINTVMGRIGDGRRVVFVTTGKKSGTGLNLGAFHGVINYELPFTCIELEQRFGRVDRLGDTISMGNMQDKEMFFFKNKGSNNMLSYSTTKIDKTCRIMPIRNTVLLQPDVVNIALENVYYTYENAKKVFETNKEFLRIYCELFEDYREAIVAFEKAVRNAFKTTASGNNPVSEDMTAVIENKIKVNLSEAIDEGMQDFLLVWMEKCGRKVDWTHLIHKAILPWLEVRVLKEYVEKQMKYWSSLLDPHKVWNFETKSGQIDEREDSFRKFSGEEMQSEVVDPIVENCDKDGSETSDQYNFSELEMFYTKELEKLNVGKQVGSGLYFIVDDIPYRCTVEEYRKALDKIAGVADNEWNIGED